MAAERFSSPGMSTQKGRLMAILWVGVTVAGNRCVVRESFTGASVWEGQAQGLNTYQGITFPVSLHLTHGAEVVLIDAGRVYFYFEDV